MVRRIMNLFRRRKNPELVEKAEMNYIRRAEEAEMNYKRLVQKDIRERPALALELIRRWGIPYMPNLYIPGKPLMDIDLWKKALTGGYLDREDKKNLDATLPHPDFNRLLTEYAERPSGLEFLFPRYTLSQKFTYQ